MISDAIATRLIAQVSAVGSRVYPVVAKQGTAQPFIVYVMDTAERQVTFSGTHELVQGELEVNCYAKSYLAAQQIAAAVRDCLVDFTGPMTANTSPLSTVDVSTIQLVGENNLQDEDPGLYRVLQRYAVWYYE